MRSPISDDEPHDPRVFLPNIEIYITNVCNLTCENCNRFNNYDFTGWQRWSDYEADYTEWAKKVRLQRIAIMGGEPLLNPTICDWVDGINRLWNRSVQVLTNGTRLNKVPGLYERMSAWQGYHPDIRNWIGVSLHNINDLDKCIAEIRKFLRGEIRCYEKHHNTPEENLTWGANYAFIDENGFRVHVWIYDSFYQAAVKRNPEGTFHLHNNDPEAAHKSCGFVMYNSHHFIKGKLYKCGPVGLFPEFDQQHKFDISDEDREIINSYRPLSAHEFDQRGPEFLKHITDVIPQCKFCPAGDDFKNSVKLYAVTKKTGSTSSFE